ncbi:MAG: J domain-containing protein [Ilumatobacter sp.]|uniref:J domain-containing protein n=1 Tax=Ilumatobacter sp. TaxID=1967498 RepID=UPI00329767CF
MNGRSHYDVLAVPTTASATTIRESYRRLAREYHPDRTMGSAAGGDKMPQINEAYRVLSDPGRRAVYDAERRGTPRSPEATSSGGGAEVDAPVYTFQHPPGPARIPWRGLLFCSLIAIVVIVALAQFGEPSGPPAPDNILRTGECVEILPNGMAGEVVCTGSGDLVVRQVTARDQDSCPNGFEFYRDRQGMVGVCLEQEPVDPTLGS